MMTTDLAHELATAAEFVREGGGGPTADVLEQWSADAKVLANALDAASHAVALVYAGTQQEWTQHFLASRLRRETNATEEA